MKLTAGAHLATWVYAPSAYPHERSRQQTRITNVVLRHSLHTSPMSTSAVHSLLSMPWPCRPSRPPQHWRLFTPTSNSSLPECKSLTSEVQIVQAPTLAAHNASLRLLPLSAQISELTSPVPKVSFDLGYDRHAPTALTIPAASYYPSAASVVPHGFRYLHNRPFRSCPSHRTRRVSHRTRPRNCLRSRHHSRLCHRTQSYHHATILASAVALAGRTAPASAATVTVV
ncbi:hypothetical protein PC123_g24500 [Phytophthora cactorum]|nr:hypothetical protein PC123_g24500 [Phytophthora cactorum]